MNRIFGTSTAKKPKPTLQDAINSVGYSPVQFPRHHRRPHRDPDRCADSLNRGQHQETRWRIDAIQGADEQAPERARQGDVRLRTHCVLYDSRPRQRAIEQRAVRVLRQKKMYEGQLAQLGQQTFNMQSAAIATENLRNTMATVEAMKLANKEIKKQYGKIDVDQIEVRGAFCRMAV